MFSGVSGLRSHQTMMDVVGNNIANVNTTGFKSSSVVFGDTLSQLTQSAAAPQNGVGGTNPSQVGLGVRVNAIANNFTQGSAQSTGKATDLMIQGDGFFVVKQGEQSFYTRAGAFSLDTNGDLITPEGAYVQGWSAASGTGDVNTSQPTGKLNVPVGKILPSAPTNAASIGGNLDPSVTAADPTVVDGKASTAFQTYDKLGTLTTVTATYTQLTATTWSVKMTVPDNAGSAVPDADTDPDVISGATDPVITFDANGRFASMTGTADASGGPNTRPATLKDGTIVNVDLSTLTAFENVSGIGVAGGKSELVQSSNGSPVGTLTSFTLNPDGTLTGSFSNGMRATLGQIALATFNNPPGLEKAGGTLFTVTTNSGGPQVGTANGGGRGKLLSGQLEMSNVDLSTEFTNLILAQRGFQANSKIITTSDEILQTVINIK
ncbi:flagellar hook protein FlgE [Kineococcus siccus]|uniref:flagellar hook protein FlgE n=1 Tax=Kineococcus siccus TaxID=2696567 RepID=UPI00196A74F4|nr:flagellar hook protein FlgE [Kineococcus siccus]